MEKRTITDAELEWFRNCLLREEKSSATIQKYLRDVRAFAHYAHGDSVGKEMVIAYKQTLMEQYAPSSVNSMLAAINHFFKEVGWYDCVVKRVKIQRQTFRDREQELTKAEYFRLVEAAQLRGDRRLCLLMQTICSTGIRISELRFITVEAVRQGRATVSLKGKTRRVLIPRALAQELRQYSAENGIRSGSVFITSGGKPLDRSNILHSMKSLCKLARVPRQKVYPHNMRHLFACQYYKAEKDLSNLADLLGHTSINTTRIYTSTSGLEHQRQIDRLGLVR